jgi:hypothetical protein
LAFDGGSVGDDKLDLLFAPAAPAVVKKTKGNKVVLGKDRTTSQNGGSAYNNSTPRSKSARQSYDMGGPSSREYPDYKSASPSPTKSTPTKSPTSSRPGTPPLPRKVIDGVVHEDDEDVWYKEWWMSCFPDAFKNLMPIR